MIEGASNHIAFALIIVCGNLLLKQGVFSMKKLLHVSLILMKKQI